MKYPSLVCFLLVATSYMFAQKSTTLWVKTDDVILQGTVGFDSYPELFVGQEYYFTIISNNNQFDLGIKSENLKITLESETKKSTGGLGFNVIPIDTGDCTISLFIGENKKSKAGLLMKRFHASAYPMPPIFITSIRSGEIIHKLDEFAEISCKYDPSLGIFEKYPIKSWKAQLVGEEFSGVGTVLSKQLIDAINKASANEVLKLTVELDKNNTGYSTSEAVFILMSLE